MFKNGEGVKWPNTRAIRVLHPIGASIFDQWLSTRHAKRASITPHSTVDRSITACTNYRASSKLARNLEQRVHCEHFRAPTAEEIALHKQSDEDHRSLVMTVKSGITSWRVMHQGCSHSEIVECPACRGRLHLSIRAHNEHVQGSCETSGCVSWTE